jgi:hypothetical protein
MDAHFGRPIPAIPVGQAPSDATRVPGLAYATPSAPAERLKPLLGWVGASFGALGLLLNVGLLFLMSDALEMFRVPAGTTCPALFGVVALVCASVEFARQRRRSASAYKAVVVALVLGLMSLGGAVVIFLIAV